jgi:hypothetical protein
MQMLDRNLVFIYSDNRKYGAYLGIHILLGIIFLYMVIIIGMMLVLIIDLLDHSGAVFSSPIYWSIVIQIRTL